MENELAGKVAIVTGSTFGLGEAIARAFVREGAAVVVNGLEADRAEAVARGLRRAGGKARAHPGDVGDSKVCEELVAAALREEGRLDVLVNNAGIGSRWKFWEVTEEEFDRIQRTNVRGAWLLSKLAAKHFIERRGGVILNTGSPHGTRAFPNSSAYAVSKGALAALTRAAAIDLAPFGVRVNTIVPGYINTDRTKEVQIGQFVGEMDDSTRVEFRRRFEAHIEDEARLFQPLHQCGRPEDIAEMAVFLAGDRAGFITGGEFLVDGGLLALMPCQDVELSARLARQRKEMADWVSARRGRRAEKLQPSRKGKGKGKWKGKGEKVPPQADPPGDKKPRMPRMHTD